MKTTRIQVVGPGCPLTAATEELVNRTLDDYRISATVEVIQEFDHITDMGVFAPPALVIDGTIRSVGCVPEQAELLDWLQNVEMQVEEIVFEKNPGKAESID